MIFTHDHILKIQDENKKYREYFKAIKEIIEIILDMEEEEQQETALILKFERKKNHEN